MDEYDEIAEKLTGLICEHCADYSALDCGACQPKVIADAIRKVLTARERELAEAREKYELECAGTKSKLETIQHLTHERERLEVERDHLNSELARREGECQRLLSNLNAANSARDR